MDCVGAGTGGIDTVLTPRLLDLFCCAGGAAMGYHRAGFDVVGVDIASQPHYPFRLIVADALDYVRDHGREYDAIHASPPCQLYSCTHTLHSRTHPDLVAPTREALIATGHPWVIENVVGAPLRAPICLCGAMFGLNVYRHRLFESNVQLLGQAHRTHIRPCVRVGRAPKAGEVHSVAGHFSGVQLARDAMGIPWMTRAELAQAIPPAYTEYVGRQLADHIAYQRRAERDEGAA